MPGPKILTLATSTAFKRTLNEVKILNAGFADLNAHLIDQHFVKPATSQDGYRYGFTKLCWVLSKLLKRSIPGNRKAPVLLVPAEPDKDRSIGLYQPITAVLPKGAYQQVALQVLFNKIDIAVFLSWLIKVPALYKASRLALKQQGDAGLLSGIASRLCIDTCIHSLWVMQLRRYFRSAGHQAVLVDWDRHTLQALVVIAARLEGVRSYTFVHGAIYTPEKFVPLIADRCLAWGEKHVDFFTGLGEQTDRLLIAGNTRFNQSLPNKQDMLARYNIPAHKKIVLHASQNFPDLEDHVIVQRLAAMMAGHDQYMLVVKSHPSQDQTLLKNKIAGLPNVILLPAAVSAKEALAMAEFTIVVSSTFSIDALIAGVPVAVYKAAEHLRGIAVELVNEAHVPLIEHAGDLSKLLSSIESDDMAASFDMQAQQQFIRHYCAYYGAQSATVIAQALTT